MSENEVTLNGYETAIFAILKGRKINYFNGMGELEQGYIHGVGKNVNAWDFVYWVHPSDKPRQPMYEGNWRSVPPKFIVGIEPTVVNTKDESKPTYMTVYNCGDGTKSWDSLPQIYLGNIPWSQAIGIAQNQLYATRLCHSDGYCNQGYYFQPIKRS